MSFTDQTTEAETPLHGPEPDPDACVHCGTPMAEDQEWCVECGAARTLIHRPPDWRVPIAVIGTVVVVAVTALAIALVNLSHSADTRTITRTVIARAPETASQSTGRTESVAATGTAPSAATTPPPSTAPSHTTTTTAAATPPGIASWPVGLSEWTVVLARYSDQATANATALRVKAEGLPAGVLNSSEHASLKPGGWLVFTGRYPSRTRALAAAQRLLAQGHSARARRVATTRGQ